MTDITMLLKICFWICAGFIWVAVFVLIIIMGLKLIAAIINLFD